jgi:hypothetical protein
MNAAASGLRIPRLFMEVYAMFVRHSEHPCVLAMSTLFALLHAIPSPGQVAPECPYDWTPEASTGPSDRARFGMCFDSIRNVMVLHGGTNGVDTSNETWEYDGTSWSMVSTAGPPRRQFSMAFDAGRGVVVLFGGNDGPGAYFRDTWEWDGTTWVQSCSSCAPSQRHGHSMVYDAARGGVLLFGGYAPGMLNDTWKWNGSSWTPVATTSPPSPRSWTAAAFDPVRDRFVFFGGNPSPTNCSFLDETWELNLNTSPAAWTPLALQARPAGRLHTAMTFDVQRGKCILFGGTNNCGTVFSDTWEFDGAAWVQLSPTDAPPPRWMHEVSYDSHRKRLVLFGGHGGAPAFSAKGDTWTFGPSCEPCGAGQTSAAEYALPVGRSDAQAGVDALGRLWIVGGNLGSGYDTRTTLRFDATAGVWVPGPNMIDSRSNFGLAVGCDGHFYVGGGFGAGGTVPSGSSLIHSRFERFDPVGGTWTALPPLPGARAYCRAAALPNGSDIIFVGGQASGSVGATSTVFRFNIPTNSWFVDPPMNVARSLHGLALDSSTGFVYAFSGDPGRTAERRDPATGEWSYVASMPGGATSQIGAGVADGCGHILAFGGYPTWTAATFAYDPALNSWSSCAPLPSAMNNMATAFLSDGSLLLIGGDSGGARRTDAVRRVLGCPVLSNRPVLVVADAGSDVSTYESASFSLTGAGSVGSEGCSLSYEWIQVAGPSVVIVGWNTPSPTAIAPDVDAGGATLTFRLRVSIGSVISDDIVNVHVVNVNRCPTAHAGDERTVAELSGVALSGAMSFDPDAEPLGFVWSQISGPAVTLEPGPTPETVLFVAPQTGPSGATLVFQLLVTDGLCTSEPDFVTVFVENVNQPPTACVDQGAEIVVDEGSVAVLSGHCSSDSDLDPLAFTWTQTQGPSVLLSGQGAVQCDFVAPVVSTETSLVIRLVVSDGLSTSQVEVTVRVRDSNGPPTCFGAVASMTELWPPNHRMVALTVKNVGDPEGRPVAIAITAITQDEPTSGTGSGDTPVDGVFDGGGFSLRAERAGSGNGRVYVVHFIATDELGQSCMGSVAVRVPKSAKKGEAVVDDGQIYPSNP